jgi:hypothetical protein
MLRIFSYKFLQLKAFLRLFLFYVTTSAQKNKWLESKLKSKYINVCVFRTKFSNSDQFDLSFVSFPIWSNEIFPHTTLTKVTWLRAIWGLKFQFQFLLFFTVQPPRQFSMPIIDIKSALIRSACTHAVDFLWDLENLIKIPRKGISRRQTHNN